ncbi:MAG TPA: hypothetical protein VF188_00195 [Longimicrobiales bacterium]
MTDDTDLIAQKAARQAVEEIFGVLGVDIHDPAERSKLIADFAYLRKSREGSEEVVRIIRRTAIGIAVSAALWVLWMGVRASFGLKIGF